MPKALELKEAADRCGLKISSLAVGADFLNGCGGDTAQEIQRGKGLGGDRRPSGSSQDAPRHHPGVLQGFRKIPEL